jgi:hypothetical protein
VLKASKILFFFPAKDARIVWLDVPKAHACRPPRCIIQIVAGDQRLLSFFLLGMSIIHVENSLAATRCQSELLSFGITLWLADTHQLLMIHIFV